MDPILRLIRDKKVTVHSDGLNKAFDVDTELEKAKHIEEVKVTRNGKTFNRKQLVGQVDEERFVKKDGKKSKDEPTDGVKLAQDHVEKTDVEKLQQYVKFGTDQKLKNIAIDELKRRGVKVREPQWYDEINAKYKIKTLPINVPKAKVEFSERDDPHSGWIMKWKDPKTGVDKYAYSAEYANRRSKVKFKRAVSLPDNFLSDIQEKAQKLIGDKNASKHQAGLVLTIMSKTGLRVGDTAHLDKTGNEGVTTLSVKSVQVKGDTVHFDFIGKSHHRNITSITDKDLAKEMSKQMKGKKPDDMIFPDVSRQYIMNTFRDDMGYKNNVLKDIRTMVACTTAIDTLYGTTPPAPMPEENKAARKLIEKRLKDCFEIVSNKLNNSPTMAKNSYINPVILHDWLNVVGGTDIVKAVHEPTLIPSLQEIADRNQDVTELPTGIYESNYTEKEDEVDDITYPMPKWMEELFEEFE